MNYVSPQIVLMLVTARR